MSQAVNNTMTKVALLAMPGVHTQSLYASIENQSVELIQSATLVGRFTASLNSTALGSSSQIVIPSNSMLSSMWLEITFDLLANCFVNDGWGYNAIQSISYIWGSSSTSQLTIQNHSIITSLLNGCQTAEARNEILYQGGQATKAVSSLTPTTITASVLLPFPWSTSADNGSEQFPFDLSLLAGGQPIIVRIDFVSNPYSFVGGPGTNVNSIKGFKTAQIVFVNVEMSDQSHSLSNSIRADPGMYSAYPMRHIQSFQSSNFVSPKAGSVYGGRESAPITIPLTSFLRSDLTAMTFSLLNISDLVGDQSKAGGFRPKEWSDVTLEYNGVALYRCPNYSYQAPWVSSRGSVGAGYYEMAEFLPVPGLVSDSAGAVTTDVFYYLANYLPPRNGMKSAFRSPTEISSVPRYPNQVVTLSFRVPETTAEATYVVAVTYTYQALVETSQSGVSIIFN